MKYKVLSPRDGETVTLLRPEHIVFLDDPSVIDDENPDPLFPDLRDSDLSTPLPVRIVYEPEADAEIFISTEPDTVKGMLLRGKNGQAFADNLLIGQKYFVKVGSGTDASEAVSFSTPDRPPRLLSIEGVYNVRDAGGWMTGCGRRVKQGVIYRTGELDVHSKITEHGKKQLAGLGVKTELDVRAPDESCGSVMDDYGIRYVNIPLSAYHDAFHPGVMNAYHDSYRLLLDNALPIFIHCWGGIDRTGTWIFLLNGMLGVSEDDLLADYEFSGFTVWGKRSRNSDNVKMFLKKLGELSNDIQSACRAYMKNCGLSDDELDMITDLLLE
ncbi:MAG: tyrosine-protein phosphatase [Clostridia bacterium]|nr:tyrosine-protein phosphatase [Clostridia bacterium]